MPMPKYWIGPVPAHDDFGRPIGNEFVDGRSVAGPWGTFTPASWDWSGCRRPLGPGVGQRYRRQPNGRWLKVEG
jgi:hypothetical protein